jgi:hypothetical protein
MSRVTISRLSLRIVCAFYIWERLRSGFPYIAHGPNISRNLSWLYLINIRLFQAYQPDTVLDLCNGSFTPTTDLASSQLRQSRNKRRACAFHHHMCYDCSGSWTEIVLSLASNQVSGR